MELLVIRHAIAEEREEFARTGQDDSLRPLTDKGRRRMKRNARALRRLAGPIDVLATSPYVRAVETAKIVADAYGDLSIEMSDALVPDAKPDALLRSLRKHDGSARVAVVGHEPHLGCLVAWLLTGRPDPGIPLKKGGACLLGFDSAPRQGDASLLWILPPAVLKRL